MQALFRERRVAPRGRAHYSLLAAGLLCLGLLLLVRFGLEPDARGWGTHEELGLPSCPTLRLTGVPCPSCGVTTALTQATRGRLLASLAAQPMGTLYALLAFAFGVWVLAVHLGGGDAGAIVRARRPWRLWPLFVGFFLGAWLYKVGAVRAWW